MLQLWYNMGVNQTTLPIPPTLISQQNLIHDIEYAIIYYLDIGISCEHLDSQQVDNICRDARFTSTLLQNIVPQLFSDIESMPNDNEGYDFKSKTTNEVYEMKNYTRRPSAKISKKTGKPVPSTVAMNYSASKYQGVGRIYNETEHFAHAMKTTYILCDIVDVPIVRIRFIKGSELVKLYPNPKVGYGERQNIFG